MFSIKLRKCDTGYPNSVANAAKHRKKWRRSTEPYLFLHSTQKTTESKVSIFEKFKIILRNQSNIFITTACDIQSFLSQANLKPSAGLRKPLWGKSPRNELFWMSKRYWNQIFCSKISIQCRNTAPEIEERNTHRLNPCKGGLLAILKVMRANWQDAL